MQRPVAPDEGGEKPSWGQTVKIQELLSLSSCPPVSTEQRTVRTGIEQWEPPLLHGFQTNLKQSFGSYGLIWSHFLLHTTELAEMIRIHFGVILWTGLCLSLVFCLCNCLHLPINPERHLSPSSSDTSVRITSLPSFSGRWQRHREAIWVKPHEPTGKKGKLNISQTIIL